MQKEIHFTDRTQQELSMPVPSGGASSWVGGRYYGSVSAGIPEQAMKRGRGTYSGEIGG